MHACICMLALNIFNPRSNSLSVVSSIYVRMYIAQTCLFFTSIEKHGGDVYNCLFCSASLAICIAIIHMYVPLLAFSSDFFICSLIQFQPGGGGVIYVSLSLTVSSHIHMPF